MPLEYLREISSGPLPLEVTDQSRIDKLRVLVAAQMVIAELPEVGQPGGAVVQRLTGVGRAWLKVPPTSQQGLGHAGDQCS